MDIWNTQNHILNSSNTGAANSASTDPLSTAYDNTLQTFTSSITSPNDYKSKFSNVEMDPLAYQMLQLSANDSISQLTTPSMIQNSYFTSNTNNNNNNNTSNNSNSQHHSLSHNNSITSSNNNLNSTWSTNNNNNNNSNNNFNNSNNSYSNYLIQQSQNQHQAQTQAQAQAQLQAQVQAQAQAQAQVQNTFTNQVKLKMKQQQNQQSQQSLSLNQAQNQNLSQSQVNNQSHNNNYMNQQSHNNLSINSFQYDKIKPDIISNNNNNINSNINNNINKNFNINQFDSRALKQNNQLKNSINNNDPSEIENLKNKLQLKDIIISKLESELEKSKDFKNTILKTQNESNGKFEIPKNYEDLYHKLVEKIQLTETELTETKTRLEALITAISMNPNPTSFKNGRYDEEEISHKIISKLKMLTEENDELSRMVSYGKSKEKDIEIALLRKQNSDLLEKMSKLEQKIADKK